MITTALKNILVTNPKRKQGSSSP